MADSIVFSPVTNAKIKNNKLKTDEEGYYLVTFGELNSFNANGDFYSKLGIEDLINNKSHALARRLASGYLKGEANHPVFEQGMTKTDYYIRNLKIDLQSVSHFIREIIITPFDTVRDPITGQMVDKVMVEAWIKPAGPYGDALKAELDDPNINVAFSVRSFTKDDKLPTGRFYKKLLQIITWDWVNEPGVTTANKWAKLSNEELTIPLSDLYNEDRIDECLNCSLENKEDKDITIEILNNFNRDKTIDKICNW